MKSQRIFVLAILVAGVFVSFSADVRADTIGFDLIARGQPNTTIGDVWGLPVSSFDGLTTPQQVSTWGFYNGIVGDEGLQITPFISKYDSTTGGYTVTGIGATRTNASTGAQTYSFDVVAGSATIGNGYTFGWIDGTPHAGNVSVAEWDGAGPVILFSYGNADPSVDLNDVLTPAMPSFTQSLSVQVTTTAIPEPSAMVMMAMAMCSLVAYAWRKRK